MRIRVKGLLLLLVLMCVSTAHAAIRTVGPGASAGLPARDYTSVCAALTAPTTVSGDIIDIDGATSAGAQITYLDEGCLFYLQTITLRGVGAKKPHITRSAAGVVSGGHGFFRPGYVGGNLIVDNLELSNAKCGASCTPVWPEAVMGSLTFRNCYIHDNDNGILVGNQALPSDQRTWMVTIENNEIAYNGTGNGLTHNVYVGQVHTLTFRYNNSHDSFGGQLLKSRAGINYVLYNRLADSWNSGYQTTVGWSNYQSDFSNGGLVFYIGNIVRQAEDVPPAGTAGVNQVLVAFFSEGAGYEGTSPNIYKQFIATHNTFVNERTASGAGIFIRNFFGTPNDTIKNNVFAGPGDVLWHTNTVQANPSGNAIYTTVAAAGFINSPGLDYRLQPGSTAVDGATTLGTLPVGNPYAMSVDPIEQYAHPVTKVPRTVVAAALDHGALERTLAGTAYIAPVRVETLDGTGQVSVFWGQAVVENTVVTGYEVYRDATLVTTAAASAKSYNDTGGTGGTAYTYTVIPKGAPDGSVSNSAIGGSARAPAATPGTGLGWHYISNSNFATTSSCSGATCSYYWYGFAGAAFDEVAHKYYLWGGDAATRNSNQVFAFQESTYGWVAVNTSDTMTSGEYASGGTTRPGARRVYQSMVWLPTQQEFFSFGGLLNNSLWSGRTWRYKPGDNTWSNHANGFTPGDNLGLGSSTYNPNTGKVLVNAGYNLYEYTPTLNTYTQVKLTNVGYKAAFIFDRINNRVYAVGDGMAGYYDPAAAYAFTALPVSCGRMKNTIYPLVDWDEARDKIVYWDKQRAVVTLDPATNTCTEQTIVGGPAISLDGTGVPGNGLQYSEALDGFWLARNNDLMVFLKLNVNPSCNDGNLCTTDSWNGSSCDNIPISCPSGQTCSLQTGQCTPTIVYQTGGSLAIGGRLGN